MKVQEAITKLIKDNGLKKAEFARRLNVSPQALNGRLTQEGIGINCVAEMVEKLNYRVVLLPDTAKLPTGSIEVTLE